MHLALVPISNRNPFILSDTMFANGGSILNIIRVIENDSPKKIFVVTALASTSALRRIAEEYSNRVIVTSAIDPKVNVQGYILFQVSEMRVIEPMEKNILPTKL